MVTLRPVLAVDPGLATGWATYDPATGGFSSGENDDPLDFCAFADGLLEAWGPGCMVACERFTVTAETAKKTAAPWSLEICGTVRYLARKHGHSFLLQTPGEAMDFCDNARLRLLGFWYRGGAGHANDASRHLALALMRVREPRVVAALAASLG